MGQGSSNSGHDKSAWDSDVSALRDISSQRPVRRVSSRLNNLITWLDGAELNEQMFDDGVALCASEFVLQNGDAHSHQSQVIKSKTTDRITRKLEQSLCCGHQLKLTPTKEGNMLTMESTKEELEWDKRQKLTGVAGRLVTYQRHESPQQDFTLRGGGSDSHRIVVASLRDDGPAYSSGVMAGDVLVSIDGKKDFIGKSADDIHAALRAPVILVFMGFVGKLSAEVRLGGKEFSKVGISENDAFVCRRGQTLQVTDEVVFQATAPLLLATPTWAVTPTSIPEHFPDEVTSDVIDRCMESIADDTTEFFKTMQDSSIDAQTSPNSIATSIDIDALRAHPTAVYELRGADARQVVTSALGGRSPYDEESLPLQQLCASAPIDPGQDRAMGPRALEIPKTATGNSLWKPSQVSGDVDQDDSIDSGPSLTALHARDNLQAKSWHTIGATPVVSPASSTATSPREA